MQTIAISQAHHARWEPGTTSRWMMTVADSLVGSLCTPLLVCRGRQPGPVLLVVAGIHGDEFEGVAAIHHLFTTLDPAQLRGTVLGLPIANPWAHEAQTRETPASIDGQNLARVFPGQIDGTPTQQLAYHLFQFVLRNLTDTDLLVDLHSGGTRYHYLPMVGYRDIPGPARAASLEAARHFGIGQLWTIPGSPPGPLNAETARAGIPTIGTEITGRGGCVAEDVATYVTGLLNLLRYREMLPGDPPPREEAAPRPTRWLYIAQAGLFHALVGLGDQVTEDQPLATVSDAYGETRAELRAGHRGEIWAVRTFATVRPGDIAFVIAEPAP